MRKLFAIVQSPQIKAWCWGSCGKGLIGSINLCEGVDAIACAQAECPHLDKDDTEPGGTVQWPDDGEPCEVWLRKLKDIGP